MTSKNNIGFVLASKEFGGAETIVKEILRKINSNENCVYLFIPSNLIKFFKDISNIKIINLGNIQMAFPFHPSILIARRIILKNIKKYDINLLNFHLPETLFLKKKNKIINTYTIHGIKYIDSFFIKSNRFKYNLKSIKNLYFLIRYYFQKALHMQKLKKTDCIISACNYFLNIVSINRIRTKKVRVENGIDLSIIHNRRNIIKNQEETKILYSGGSRDEKGWDILIKAINILSKRNYRIKLYILRDVPENHPIRKYVEDHDLKSNVLFVGFCNRERYLDYIYSCDLFCLPSYTEGIAASLMDCLGLGKPVIATEVGGTPEIIKDGENGFLCKPNYLNLAMTLENAIKNKEKLKKMGKNNLEKAKDFSWDIIIKKYEDLFNSLIKDEI